MNEDAITTETILSLSKKELESYIDTKTKALLPSALEKLKVIIEGSSKPADVRKNFELLCEYSNILKASDRANFNKGLSTGVTLSAEAFNQAFQGMAQMFGVGTEASIKEVEGKDMVIKQAKKKVVKKTNNKKGVINEFKFGE